MKLEFKPFFKKCARVWRVLKKPSKDEFTMVAKVSGIGILVIGAVGFAFALIMGFLI